MKTADNIFDSLVKELLTKCGFDASCAESIRVEVNLSMGRNVVLEQLFANEQYNGGWTNEVSEHAQLQQQHAIMLSALEWILLESSPDYDIHSWSRLVSRIAEHTRDTIALVKGGSV